MVPCEFQNPFARDSKSIHTFFEFAMAIYLLDTEAERAQSCHSMKTGFSY